MANIVLAVYDVYPSYVERFLNYANRRNDRELEVLGFTDLTILREQLKNNKIHAVLISQTSLTVDHNTLGNLCTGADIKDGVVFIYLGDQPAAGKEEEDHGWIGKYQSTEIILAQAKSYVKERLKIPENSGRRQDLHISGLYSPADKRSHPRMAAALARKLQKEQRHRPERTLYINLEQFSGMQSLLDEGTPACISDVIYFYKTNPRKLREGLMKTAGSYQGMDVLTAPADMADLEEVGRKGWPDFLAALAEAGDYPYIIIDMSVCNWDVFETVFEYGNLYIPAIPYSANDRKESAEELSAREKLEEFREQLDAAGFLKHPGKVREIRLGPG